MLNTSLKLVFTSLFLYGASSSLQDSGVTSCLGGREEFDKWFDGCRWCMCVRGRPMCSSEPDKCSDLISKMPPCENYGSRWTDGCYHCRCRVDGIECRADPACHVLKFSALRNFHSDGTCLEPNDDRCICGVDGVPSCSAEVIDRTAFQTTTIGLDANFRHSTPIATPSAVHYYENDKFSRDRNNLPYGTHRNVADRRYKRGTRHAFIERSLHNNKPTFHSQRHRPKNIHGERQIKDFASHHKGSRQHDRYVLAEEPSPSEGTISQMTRSEEEMQRLYELIRLSQRMQLQKLRKRQREEASKAKAAEDERDQQELDSWQYATDRRDATKGGFVPSAREVISNEADTPGLVHIPPSLLVASDNRCRFGARWYGGGLRCFCSDVDGSITCGDPMFVATRIDGFRLKKIPCEMGHIWEEAGSCQVCECEAPGVVLCRRSSRCPLPFLIQAVAPINAGRDEDMDTNAELNSGDVFQPDWDNAESGDRTDDELGELEVDKRRGGIIDLSNPPTDSPTIVVDQKHYTKGGRGGHNNRPTRLPYKYNRYHPKVDFGDSKHHGRRNLGSTLVKIMECKPRSRWMDGCKRCVCDGHGRKHCDESRCLKAELVTMESSPIFNRIPINDLNEKRRPRPYQRPPPIAFGRDKPVPNSSYRPPARPCGRFKVGQRFWSECNLCLCLRSGPKCTAKNCG